MGLDLDNTTKGRGEITLDEGRRHSTSEKKVGFVVGRILEAIFF